ncbi:MAG: gliding motility-associated C-terminal domain-containing protein [Flavobacteriales bacterium]|nr:gliding motility-associated C-terminal domain-containing protein [Flavobacteriales bacterium]
MTPTGTSNPNDPCDPIGINTTDTDGDGLTDCEETTGVDDPSTPLTPTGTSNPNDPCDPIGINTTDTDGDGLTDCEETTGVDDPSTPLVPTGPSDPNNPCDPIGNSASIDTQVACDSYTWMDGITYTASNNTATETLVNAAGCDSIITLNLTINTSVASTVSDSMCISDTYVFGTQNLTTAGVYVETFTAANGCDSTVTLTLSIDATDTDGDGLTDCEELTGIDDPSTPTVPSGTSNPDDPCDPIGINTVDTDGDGLTDCEELTGIDDPSTPTVPTGTSNPNDPCDPIGINTVDTDGDGLTDCEELTGVDDPSTPLVPTGTSDPDDPCNPRPCDLIVPEGFTPNGDNYNDLFVIEGIGNYPGNEILIFNRWGNQVFEMLEYDNSWNGVRNVGSDITGDQLPTGTYYYILDTKDETIGDKGIFQGFIFLKR